jgi:hypothetical protein
MFFPPFSQTPMDYISEAPTMEGEFTLNSGGLLEIIGDAMSTDTA